MLNPIIIGFSFALVPFAATIFAVASIAAYHWAFPTLDANDESNS